MANFKRWLVGLANAAVSGATSGLLASGLGVGAKKVAIIAGGSALVSVCKWVMLHPLPGAEEQAQLPEVKQ